MEARSQKPADTTQAELLTRYCDEAEGLLAEATDYESALRLRDDVCGRFQRECRSALIINATHEYLTQIITQRWQQSHDRNH